MPKYRDLPISQRIDKIGELLAKGVYLYAQKQKELEKADNTCDNKDVLKNSNTAAPGSGECKSEDPLY